MQCPRLFICLLLLALGASVLAGCGDGLALPATPTSTRVPVLPPSAPALPAGVAAEPTATEAAPAPSPAPSSTPAAALAAIDTPTQSPPEDTATPEPTATPAPTATPEPAAAIEFSPTELVQGGAAIVYFNLDARAATMTFGGKQYPMLYDGDRWWAIIGIGAFAEAGDAPITVTYDASDGSPQTSVSGSIPIVARSFPVENIDLDPTTSALLDPAIVNNEEALRASIFSGYTTQRLWSGTFQLPVAGGGATSDIYGVARSYNGGPVTSYHRGTDFLGNTGDPVYAAAAGRVVFADTLQVRGNSVIVDHGVGVFTTYNHLSAINVSAGDTVEAGQQLGQLGSTGLVTGPHLHWEVVVRGIEVDGQLWLAGAVGQ